MEKPQGVGASVCALSEDRRALLDGLRRTVRALESPPPRWGRVTLGAGDMPALARGCAHEVVPAAYLDGPAAAGVALMLAARAMAQTRGGMALVWGPGAGEFGAPYAPGLAVLGLDLKRVLFVRPRTPAETLSALEEAARTPGLSAVAGFAPGRLGLSAGRRLSRSAEEGGVFVCLWRGFGVAPLEGARTRWRVGAAASAAADWAAGLGAQAPPGPVRVRVAALKGRCLERDMVWEWQGATHGFHSFAPVAGATPQPTDFAVSA
jgi:protein ImuA